MDWIKARQPEAWARLTKSQGSAALAALMERIHKQLADRGTLDILRHGVEMIGLRAPIQLAQFRPAIG
jgi:type I restriction enzyme R subunit